MFDFADKYLKVCEIAYKLGLTKKMPEVKLIASKITGIQPTKECFGKRFYITEKYNIKNKS